MSNQMFCRKCGAPLALGEMFCTQCGEPVSQMNQQAPPVSQGFQQQGNYSMPYGQQPPMQMRPQKSSKAPLFIIIGIIAVALAAAAVYFVLTAGKNGSGQNNGYSNSGQNVQQQGTSSELDYKNAATYAPVPNKRMKVLMHWPDGTSGYEFYQSAVIGNAALVSVVEYLPQSEGVAIHYFQGPDGIYSCYDQDFQQTHSLWLIDNPTVGASWDYLPDVKRTITQTDATLDLGFAKFDHCIVVQTDNNAVGYYTESYIAPGLGEIYSVYKGTTSDVVKLVSIEDVDPAEATDLAKRCSPVLMGNSGQ